MIHDIFLRWLVTVLFTLSAAGLLFTLATGHRRWTHAVCHLLHFCMSVAMAVTAWPWGATLPTTGPMVFFLLAVFWFVAVGITGVGHRLVNGYHALMMLAMAWMYAALNGNLLPGQGGTAPAHDMSSRMEMTDMEMSGMERSSSGGGCPVWIDAVNWVWTIGFAVAALWWLYRCFTGGKAEARQPSHRFLDAASQPLMAAGMAIMFGAML